MHRFEKRDRRSSTKEGPAGKPGPTASAQNHSFRYQVAKYRF